MADGDAIEKYVRELEASLRRAGRPTEPLVDEARAHLHEDAARIAAAEGCGDAEAGRRAVARFGGVGDVMRAVRANRPMTAALVARVATLMLAAALAYDLWWQGIPDGRWIWLSFPAELALVSVVLWRALAGRRAPAWLAPVLVAQATLGGAMFVLQSSTGVRSLPAHLHLNMHHVLEALAPFWLAMLVQGAAGLLALRQQATQVGQPSFPVELQPPG